MTISSVWAQTLRPASFGGFRFFVRRDEATMGRRVITHVYPFRDRPYLEDLGAAPKCYSFDAFLTGDDVIAQRRNFETLLDKPGLRMLVHPTKGAFQAMLTSASFLENAERGRMIECRLTFAVADDTSSADLFPATFRNTIAQSQLQSLNLVSTNALSYISAISSVIARGVAVVNAITSTILRFVSLVRQVITSPMAIISSICGLARVFTGFNVNFGRYDQGNVMLPSTALLGLSQITSLPDRVNAATSTLLSVATVNAATVAASAAKVVATSPTSQAFGAGLAGTLETVRQGIGDVGDQIASLSTLAAFKATATGLGQGAISEGVAIATTATAALCRRMTLCALTTATSAYNPTSSQDVSDLLDLITPLYDAEIADAADAGDTQGYAQLRAARTAVTNDLSARGSQLPELIEYQFPVSMPSMVSAYRIYQDSNRRDDLVARADPQNPLFMPTDYMALSA